MMRGLLALGAMAFTLTTAQPTAQTRPDFTGTWTAFEPASSVGTSIAITQDATALRVDIPLQRFTLSTGGMSVPSAGSPVSIVRHVYTLDGRDSLQSVPDPPPPPPGSLGSGHLIKSVARASWMDGQLVIVTHNTHKLTRPGRTPPEADLEQTVWEKLSLDSDGHLVVDRVIIADPLPWATEIHQDPPMPWKAIYKKTS